MMESPTVVLSATPQGTMVLMKWGVHECLKAMLPPAESAHRSAAPLLLEGLAQFFGRRLSVALCVDGIHDLSGLGLCNAIGGGVRTVHYEVEVVDLTQKGLRLHGVPGDFSRLRRIRPRRLP